MTPGSLLIAHLADPPEKYWGVLRALDPAGVTLTGIHLGSFDDWVRAVAEESEPSLGLTTVFFPLRRVQQLFLDEDVGAVESYRRRFARRVGRSVEEHLGLAPDRRSG